MTNEKSPELEDNQGQPMTDFSELADERLIEGAHWQVVGPNPIPSGARAATSTETYAVGFTSETGNSWVVQAARQQIAARSLLNHGN